MRWRLPIVGAAATISLVFTIMGGVPSIPASARQPASSQASGIGTAPTPSGITMSRRETIVKFLDELSIDAKSLCAASISGNEMSAMIANASAFFQSYEVPIRSARSELTALRASQSTTPNAAGSTPAMSTQTATVHARLDQSLRNFNSLLDSAFAATIAGLPPEKAAMLAALRSNRKHGLPTHLLVINRSQTEWNELRRAMEQSTARRRAGTQPSESSAIIATALAHPSVSAARQRLSTSLPATRLALRDALASLDQ